MTTRSTTAFLLATIRSPETAVGVDEDQDVVGVVEDEHVRRPVVGLPEHIGLGCVPVTRRRPRLHCAHKRTCRGRRKQMHASAPVTFARTRSCPPIL